MNIPKMLIAFRFVLAPVILWLAYQYGASATGSIVILMYLGLLSDILDGIVARKLEISSAALRRMDSQTDMLFWLSIGIATWMIFPEVLAAHSTAIWVILGMEIACYGISLIKFKRETCTHAWLSKLWGVTLLIAFTSLLGFAHAGIPFYTALFVGFIAHIDRILITLVLPKWTHDVPSAYHAFLIRKGIAFKRNVYLNG